MRTTIPGTSETSIPTQDRSPTGPESGSSPEPLLTAEDVAAWLRCSRQAVYLWAELGEIPHIKIGRLLRFDRADLVDYLAERRRAFLPTRAMRGPEKGLL